MSNAQSLIRSLGVSSSYKGSSQLAVAVIVALENEDSLLSLTKCLYPAVAEELHTTPYCIERNLRTFITACWKRGNRKRLEEIAGFPLLSKPCTGDFIGFLVTYLQRHAE